MFANTNEAYDVVICGAGLAGLSLARQLKLNLPDLSVLVLSKAVFPLSDAGKVGESTVEIAAYYFARILQMERYFLENHYRKMGFRLFFGDGAACLSERSELGVTGFSPFDSYQIDRVRLENDLVELCGSMGVVFEWGVQVRDIQLSESGDLHRVVYKEKGDPKRRQVDGRWVIDAMGRRRYLQKKLDLTKPPERMCSSAWFWVEGKLDVSDWVPTSETAWHERVPEGNRYFSTNHLMGDGYWIWIIPLSSGHTSVGIVTLEEAYPFSGYYSQAKAMAWLNTHQPVLARHLEGRTLVNFQKLKNYSYSSHRLFHEHRWACIGEAGVFPDPFYSPGSNFVGFENCIVLELIRDDLQGALSKERVAGFNEFIISQNDWFTHTIQEAYRFHGKETVMFFNFMWITLLGWLSATPQMFNGIFLDAAKEQAVRETTPRLFQLTQQMQRLFHDWAAQTRDTFSFRFINYLAIPFVKEIYDRNMIDGKDAHRLGEEAAWGLAQMEHFAQAIFLTAVEDCYPEAREGFDAGIGYDVSAFDLDPNTWEGLLETGLQDPERARIYEEICDLFHQTADSTRSH